MTSTAGPGRCPRCGGELGGDAVCIVCGPVVVVATIALDSWQRRKLMVAGLGMAVPLILGGASLALISFGQLVATAFIRRDLLQISALGTVVSVLMIWLGVRILGTVLAKLAGRAG
jgi:hypothetical protein